MKLKKLDKFFKKHGYWLLFAILFLILLFERAIPYILHGPFGFGYDTGIYKKTFEGMVSFSDVLTVGNISPLPAFLAYVSNLLHLPISFITYYLYIFFSAFVSVPLYLLVKECFKKREIAIVAVVLFIVSYTQAFASEFYLYKAIMGSSFLLFAFYYYIKKSYWFYLFTLLLAFTQLPHLLILGFGVFIGTLVDFKKNLKFNLIAFGVFLISFVLLLLVSWKNVYGMFGVFWDYFVGTNLVSTTVDKAGLFFPLSIYIKKEFWIFLLGIIGVILSRKNDKVVPLIASVAFLVVFVFNKIFFENRFIILMSLFFIIFAAYVVVQVFSKSLKQKYFRWTSAFLLILISLVSSFYYYRVIPPTLTPYEIGAIKTIEAKTDTDYVMVVDTFYAPWLYGFSGKTVLAPGLFKSVWNMPQFGKYIKAARVERIKMLLDVSDEYGKFYLFEGHRQAMDELGSPRIKKIYDIYGARIYAID